ncbi:MAG TPA: zinc-finger domain-containing protein [Methyloceanibacter sp.]|nr:zinc-finger domain-containing protein [Methyloceanibacter sp.]
MAQTLVPHLINDQGVGRIGIGVKEFQCMGASPPHDHPHVYLDMGDDAELVCPYCSTLYVYDPALRAGESDPSGCVYVATAPAGAPEA